MLKLYIVRHGETEFNVQKRMQGRLDSPLTQKGIDNAAALGKHLKGIEFDRIYASPSSRAFRTAELIRGDGDTPIEAEDNLREMNLADFEGKTREDIKAQYPALSEIFWNSPQLFKPKMGESYFDVQDRAVAFINKLIRENPEGNILIITHSVVIKTLIVHYLKYPMEKLWAPPFVPGTSVTLLTSGHGETKLEVVGDVSHLG